jgi:DNA-binding XRE family transcriptional regulator
MTKFRRFDPVLGFIDSSTAMTQPVVQTWIRQMREEANLTQEQLAVLLNISSSTLRTWEKGKVEPSMTIQQWVKFARAVNVPLEELPVKVAQSA